MLEMAEGTIWGLRAIVKIANCVCSGSNTSVVQYSARRPRTAYLKQEGGVNANVICDSFFLFFIFCFLVPLRGTENLHKSIHLQQSILLGTQRPLLTHTHKNKALASDTTKP